ncbi:hypothetical protein CPB86DRAFT_716241 [Serendipita vermifera]|nr:hypothetical protein CPB86DRAFT_716241 [Serendipita vermifera]
MTSPDPAINRIPLEIWTEIFEFILLPEVLSLVNFFPDTKGPHGHFLSYVNHEFRPSSEPKPKLITKCPSFSVLSSVSQAWKRVVDSLRYLTRVLDVERRPTPETDHHHEEGRLIAAEDEFKDPMIDEVKWRQILQKNPRTLFIKIREHYGRFFCTTEEEEPYLFRILIDEASSLRHVVSLKLRVMCTNNGIMSQISSNFPQLLSLDIRIQFDQFEESIADVEDLNLPHVETLRIDTDRWGLYGNAFRTWKLPRLKAVTLTANGGCYDDSNPSPEALHLFLTRFGSNITHLCLFICVPRDLTGKWLIPWNAVPSLKELITHPAVEFWGPAPPESSLERITVMDATKPAQRWLSEVFDMAYDRRKWRPDWQPYRDDSLRICLGNGRWPKAGNVRHYSAQYGTSWYDVGRKFYRFCSRRGWNLEDGLGQEWGFEQSA